MRRAAAGRGGAVLGIAALVLAGCGTVSASTGSASTGSASTGSASTGSASTGSVTGTGPGPVTASQLDKAGGWAVRGTFEMEGGPIEPGATSTPARPLSGVVMFRAASGRTIDITAGPTGQFAGYLPAGTYTVTARTGQIRQQNQDGSVSDPPCTGPVAVVVRPGQTTRVALVCTVP